MSMIFILASDIRNDSTRSIDVGPPVPVTAWVHTTPQKLTYHPRDQRDGPYAVVAAVRHVEGPPVGREGHSVRPTELGYLSRSVP
eukprot:6388272-Pyramimonas_sp.AAC.1